MLPHGITLRPVGSEDEAFLHRLYASTRQEELALVHWPAEEMDAFMAMQFRAQNQHYMNAFPNATFDIVVVDNHDIGRLYVDRRQDEIHIIDIALLPDYRNLGIGSALLKELIQEAGTLGVCVRMHVERNNPALRLYQRLGFEEVRDIGLYVLMECLGEQIVN